jgi:NDP-sugar pyrophosphorylase family protein
LELVKEYLNTETDRPRPSLKYETSLKEERGKHDATGFYINWLIKKESVYGFLFDGRWYDIGHHQFYNEAKEKFKEAN